MQIKPIKDKRKAVEILDRLMCEHKRKIIVRYHDGYDRWRCARCGQSFGVDKVGETKTIGLAWGRGYE